MSGANNGCVLPVAGMASSSSMALDLEMDGLKRKVVALRLARDVQRMKQSSSDTEVDRLVNEIADLKVCLLLCALTTHAAFFH